MTVQVSLMQLIASCLSERLAAVRRAAPARIYSPLPLGSSCSLRFSYRVLQVCVAIPAHRVVCSTERVTSGSRGCLIREAAAFVVPAILRGLAAARIGAAAAGSGA